MKSNSIRTYWAKDITIEAIYGSKFEFTLNVKNKDGSNYNFPTGHVAFFGVYKEEYFFNFGEPLHQNQSGSPSFYIFNTTIEDGKISVTAHDEQLDLNALLAVPGQYKHVLFTYDPEDAGAGFLEISSAEENPNAYLRVGYQHPESTIVHTVEPTTLNGVGYYHEWYLLPGDDEVNAYCTIGAPTPIQANMYEGQTSQQYLLSYPFNYSFYSDSEGMWHNDHWIHKQAMPQLETIIGIQQKNVVKCLWPVEPGEDTNTIWDQHAVTVPSGSIPIAPSVLDGYMATPNTPFIPGMNLVGYDMSGPVYYVQPAAPQSITYFTGGEDTYFGVDDDGNQIVVISGQQFDYDFWVNLPNSFTMTLLGKRSDDIYVKFPQGTPHSLTSSAEIWGLNSEEITTNLQEYVENNSLANGIYDGLSSIVPWGPEVDYINVPSVDFWNLFWLQTVATLSPQEAENAGVEISYPAGNYTGVADGLLNALINGSPTNFVNPTDLDYYGQNSVFYGFVSNDIDSQTLSLNSPAEYINTMVSYQEPEDAVPYTQELYNEWVSEGQQGVTGNPWNVVYTLGSEANNPAYETFLNVTVKASIVNMGNADAYQSGNFTGDGNWPDAVAQGNSTTVRYGIEYLDTGETIVEQKEVFFEPLYNVSINPFFIGQSAGAQGAGAVEEIINDYPDVYSPIYYTTGVILSADPQAAAEQTLPLAPGTILNSDLPRNFETVLEFNNILSQVQPNSKVKLFFSVGNLVNTFPYLTRQWQETIYGTEVVSSWETVENIVEVPVTETVIEDVISYEEVYNSASLSWEGALAPGENNWQRFIDIPVNEGDTDVLVAGYFKTQNSSTDTEFGDYWDGETLTYQTGMNNMYIGYTVRVKQYTWIRLLQVSGTSTNQPSYADDEIFFLDSLSDYTDEPGNVGVPLSQTTSWIPFRIIAHNLTTGEEAECPCEQGDSQDEFIPIYQVRHRSGYAQNSPYRAVESTNNNVRIDLYELPEGFLNHNDEIKFYFHSGTHHSTLLGTAPPSLEGYPAIYEYPSYQNISTEQFPYVLSASSTSYDRLQNSGEDVVEGHPAWNTEYVEDENRDVYWSFTKTNYEFYANRLDIEWSWYTTNEVITPTETEVITYVSQVVETQVEVQTEVETEDIVTNTERVISGFNRGICNIEFSDFEFQARNLVTSEETTFYGGTMEDLLEFDYKFKLINRDTGQEYLQWTKTATLELGNYAGLNYAEFSHIINFEDVYIGDGAPLQITVEPDGEYRRFNNDEEGYIRLTKTELSSAWKNYSYFSGDLYPQIPSQLNYWLFGNFVLKRNV